MFNLLRTIKGALCSFGEEILMRRERFFYAITNKIHFYLDCLGI